MRRDGRLGCPFQTLFEFQFTALRSDRASSATISGHETHTVPLPAGSLPGGANDD